MNAADVRDIERAYVHKGDRLAGTVERTKHGARFLYDKTYLQFSKEPRQQAVAFNLPLSDEPYEIRGDNLHPFFAGLLPEGLRLTALISALKTSADDMFSLLAASGADTIGDVYITLDGVTPADDTSDGIAPEEVSFHELLDQSLASLGLERGRNDISIPGVQPKISATTLSLPISIAKRRKRYLLKLAPDRFPRLAENEHFFMELAARCGLETAKTSVVKDREGISALLIERFDRVWQSETNRIIRLHQEDACQFLDRYPQDKYRLSMRQIADGLAEVSTSPIVEQSKLLKLTVFSYLIGNGDMHGKNVSVFSSGDKTVLTPAYDLVSTLPYGDTTMALELEGRKTKLRVKDFIVWGQRVGLREAATRSIIKNLVERIQPAIDELEQIGLEDRQTAQLQQAMRERALSLRALG